MNTKEMKEQMTDVRLDLSQIRSDVAEIKAALIKYGVMTELEEIVESDEE